MDIRQQVHPAAANQLSYIRGGAAALRMMLGATSCLRAVIPLLPSAEGVSIPCPGCQGRPLSPLWLGSRLSGASCPGLPWWTAPKTPASACAAAAGQPPLARARPAGRSGTRCRSCARVYCVHLQPCFSVPRNVLFPQERVLLLTITQLTQGLADCFTRRQALSQLRMWFWRALSLNASSMLLAGG